MSYRKPTREQVVRQAMMPAPSTNISPISLDQAAEERRLIKLGNRIRRLPVQLALARAKVARLEEEARSFGMIELLAENDR